MRETLHLILHRQLILLLHHQVLPLCIRIIDLYLDGFFLLLDLLRECHLLREALRLSLRHLLQRFFQQRLIVLLISQLQYAVIVALRYLNLDLVDDLIIYNVLLLILGDPVQLIDLLLVLSYHLILLLHVPLELLQDVLVVLGQLNRLQLLLHARHLLRVETILQI